MNILLIHPPTEEDLLFKEIIGLTPQPIGLGYVAATIEEEHEVDILDIPAEDITKHEFIRKLQNFNPDIIGMYLATYRHQKAKKYLKTIKEYSKNIKTICGGPHSTVTAENLIKSDCIDVIISGEGELIFPELIDAIENNKSLRNIKGIVFEKNNKVITTDSPPKIDDLDNLPKPSRHLFDMSKYKLMNTLNIASIISSRGCPSDCNFCSVPAIFGTKCRLRSAKNIVDEIEAIKEEYGPDFFMFMDDNFDFSVERVWEICNLIEERDLDIRWGCCSSGINSDEPRLMKRMKETGCRVLSYNLESGSQKSIDVMNSNTTKEKTKKDMKLAEEMGFIKILNVVIGLPGETRKDILESIEFAKNLKSEFPLFFLPTPYPGTQFYKTAKRQGMIEEVDWEKYTSYNPIIGTGTLEINELKNLLGKAYKECYLDKYSLINRSEKLIKSLIDDTISFNDLPNLIKQSMHSINYIRKL